MLFAALDIQLVLLDPGSGTQQISLCLCESILVRVQSRFNLLPAQRYVRQFTLQTPDFLITRLQHQ